MSERRIGRGAPRRRRLLAAALPALALAGCGGEGARPAPPRPSASASGGAPPAALPPGATRVALPPGAPPPVQLRRVPGARVALATVEAAERDDLWVRALTEAGPAGPALRVEGARLAAALPLGDEVALVLSRGGELCVRVGLASGAREACAASSAKAVYATRAGVLFFVDVEGPPPKPQPKAAPRGPAKPPAKRPPRPKGPKKPKGKPKAPGKAPAKPKGRPAPAPPREPSKLVVRRFTAADGFEAPRATGLTFLRVQPGLDVAGALGGETGGWVAFHEPGKKPKGPMGSARLSWIELDAAGATIGKAQPLAEGELEWGGVKGLWAPRLVSTAKGPALATLGSPAAASRDALSKGACSLAAPGQPDRKPSELACALGVFDAADADLEPLAPLVRRARRVPGQAASDPPYGAFAGARFYFLEDGRLRSARGGDARDERAFDAAEVALAGPSIAGDGEALFVSGGELRRVTAAGELVSQGRLPTGARAGFVRIGSTWFLDRGAARRVSEARPAADGDATVLVGGQTTGWQLTVARSRDAGLDLELARVDEAGAASPVARAPSPVGVGFAAAADGRGGALVVGPSRADPARLVAAQVSPSGAVGDAVDLGARLEGLRRVELAATGEGAGAAAVAWLPDTGEVLWLDGAGREVGAARAPRPTSSCPGFPAGRVPAARPGAFEALPAVLPDPGRRSPSDPPAEGAACSVGLGAFSPRAAFLVERAGLELRGSYVRLPPSSAPAPPSPPPAEPGGAAAAPARRCPPEMVAIPARGELAAYCIDRFEASLVQASGDAAGDRLSPDYAPAAGLLEASILVWSTARERTGDLHAQALPLPSFPAWQRQVKVAPLALSRGADRPNGYVTGFAAEQACAAAGKRLCTQDEFVTACRGEQGTLFPYGDDFEDGACNVFRDRHPAALLHGNASIGHLDPRLNRVPGLFAHAGAHPRCRSVWGDDAAYDLVGNLDEWIDDEGGAFAGGFYARSTRAGCEALIDAHPRAYADYSTGVRCCRSGEGGRAP